MVNRRGIYKDVYGSPKDREWSDYQVSLLSTALAPAPKQILDTDTYFSSDPTSLTR